MVVNTDFMLTTLLVLAVIGLVISLFMREMLRIHVKYLNTMDDKNYSNYIIQFLRSQNISVCKCNGDSYYKQHNIISVIYRKFDLAVVISNNWERDLSLTLHHMINEFIVKFVSNALEEDVEKEWIDQNFLSVSSTALMLIQHQSDSNSGEFNTFDLNGIFLLCYMIKDYKYEISKLWIIFCMWRFIMNHKIVKDETISLSFCNFVKFVYYLNQKISDLDIDDEYYKLFDVDLHGEMNEDVCINLALEAISAQTC